MKKIKEPDNIKLTEKEISSLKTKIQQSNLSRDEQELLVKMVQGFVWLSEMLEAKKMSMKKLMRLFGFRSEKSKREKDNNKDNKGNPPASSPKSGGGGHGRNGQGNYPGAERVSHQHDTLKVGDRCPLCYKGKLYETNPGTFISVTGTPPLQATIHELQKLRCNTCGEIFTAKLPEDIKKQKYDEKADVMIALMKYGMGTPFYRMDKIQKCLGIPLPASTQWERVENLANGIHPVFWALEKEAALGKVGVVDDTGNKIINLKKFLRETDAKRSGIYTTGIVSTLNNQVINLFYTSNRHAGENLDRLLKHRPNTLPPIIQMSDALANNHTKVHTTELCNCLTHGRRNFYDNKKDHPKECAYVIDHLIGKVYGIENQIKKRKLTDDERLTVHQRKSAPIMKKLRRWCLKCFYLRKIEPNSNLGGAIQYLLNHWKELTQFLRVSGAPLDTNIVERLLKTAILHRKNSLFYMTEHGAIIGDILMSMIQTCISAGKNPFNYLVTILKNRTEVVKNPKNYFPWCYEENLISSPA